MGFLFILLLMVPGAAITGGVAGAIVGGGREDRPIWVNALIGLAGFGTASAVLSALNDGTAQEFSLGHVILALLFSIGLVLLMERREAESSAGGQGEDAVDDASSDKWRRVVPVIGLGLALLALFWLLSMFLALR